MLNGIKPNFITQFFINIWSNLRGVKANIRFIITATTGFIGKVDGYKIYDYEYQYYLETALSEEYSENYEEPENADDMSEEELADKLNSNADFLKITGGGVTISGGEPMMQSEFVCALADALPDMHKAIQTSGYTDLKTYKKVKYYQ